MTQGRRGSRHNSYHHTNWTENEGYDGDTWILTRAIYCVRCKWSRVEEERLPWVCGDGSLKSNKWAYVDHQWRHIGTKLGLGVRGEPWVDVNKTIIAPLVKLNFDTCYISSMSRCFLFKISEWLAVLSRTSQLTRDWLAPARGFSLHQ